MPNSPKIRFVKEKDLDKLVALCEQHAAYEESDYVKQGKKESLSKYLFSKQPFFYCLVVELESDLIGYATFMKQFSTWEGEFYVYMDCLFLNEFSRGFGLGEKLLNRIKVESINLGCSLIQWQTPTFNEGAIRFYNRMGAKAKSKERFFLELNSEKCN